MAAQSRYGSQGQACLRAAPGSYSATPLVAVFRLRAQLLPAPVTPAASKRTAASGTGLLWLGLIDRQGTALQVGAIKALDRRREVLRIGHFDKAKPARPASDFIHDHGGRCYRPHLAEQ